MTLTFLSPEWADAVKAALNVDEAFKQGSAGQQATIQQVITTDGGETQYWIRVADGTIDMGVGTAENPDATITHLRQLSGFCDRAHALTAAAAARSR